MFETAIKILNILYNEGYESYIVGGYVRDKLLNVKSNDIDIITNAKPYKIKEIFGIHEKERYGCINLKYGAYAYEITTYREEIYLNDSRKPMINYVNSLKKDLLRRDFTINSICIDKDGNYIDLLNGIKDINSKVINIIGNSDKKLKEDPLRILRALRFSSLYNFKLSDELKTSILNNKKYLINISYDRIKAELDIVFKANKANNILSLMNELEIFEIIKIQPKNRVIECSDYLGIWAQLDYSMDYNFSKIEKRKINNIREIVNQSIIDDYILYKYDIDEILISASILNIDDDYLKKKSNLKIHSKKDIDITYDEIIRIFPNLNINKIYMDLETQILYNKLNNEKGNIIEYLENNYKEE